VQGYREIVGDTVFFRFTKELLARFEHDNISTREFIAFAVQRSGLDAADRAQLRSYFEQWLYGETKPTILPESFN